MPHVPRNGPWSPTKYTDPGDGHPHVDLNLGVEGKVEEKLVPCHSKTRLWREGASALPCPALGNMIVLMPPFSKLWQELTHPQQMLQPPPALTPYRWDSAQGRAAGGNRESPLWYHLSQG